MGYPSGQGAAARDFRPGDPGHTRPPPGRRALRPSLVSRPTSNFRVSTPWLKNDVPCTRQYRSAFQDSDHFQDGANLRSRLRRRVGKEECSPFEPRVYPRPTPYRARSLGSGTRVRKRYSSRPPSTSSEVEHGSGSSRRRIRTGFDGSRHAGTPKPSPRPMLVPHHANDRVERDQ